MILDYKFNEVYQVLPIGTIISIVEGDKSRGGTIVSFSAGPPRTINVDIGVAIRHIEENDITIFSIPSEEFTTTPAAIDAALIKQIEQDQESVESAEMNPMRRIAAMLTWAEFQDFTANQAQILALTAEQRNKRIPFLAAIKLETGATWAAVATGIENRLWPVIRRTALFEARAVVSKNRIRSSTTVEAKLNQTNIVWTE